MKKLGNAIFVTVIMILLLIIAIVPFIAIYYLFIYSLNHTPGITYFTNNPLDKIRFVILFIVFGVILLAFFEALVNRAIIGNNIWNKMFKYTALFLLNVIYVQVFIIISTDIEANLIGVFLITVLIYLVELLLNLMLYLLKRIDKKIR
ncbi:hypothetical protein ACYRFT_03815 [Listeria kieliensis]